MAIDSTIFFPKDGFRVKIHEPLLVGGAAFGGGQVAGVDLTIDNGKTWQSAEIVEKAEQDHVWVFWKASLLFTEKGSYTIQAKAIDISGNQQPRKDSDKYDGANSWAEVTVKVFR